MYIKVTDCMSGYNCYFEWSKEQLEAVKDLKGSFGYVLEDVEINEISKEEFDKKVEYEECED